jgi:thiol:disulfide interchange protein DsbD
MRIAAVIALATACAATPEVTWARDEADAFTRARAERKGVLLHFRARWSVPSEELHHTLHTSAVAGAIASRFVPVEIDVSDQSDAVAAIQERYHVTTSPAIVLISTDGTIRERITSTPDEAELRAAIEKAR